MQVVISMTTPAVLTAWSGTSKNRASANDVLLAAASAKLATPARSVEKVITSMARSATQLACSPATLAKATLHTASPATEATDWLGTNVN